MQAKKATKGEVEEIRCEPLGRTAHRSERFVITNYRATIYKRQSIGRIKMFLLLMSISLFLLIPANIQADPTLNVVVYAPIKGCAGCGGDTVIGYFTHLQEALEEGGIVDIELIRLDADELKEVCDSLDVPEYMQGTTLVSIDEKFLFINYVPTSIIREFLANHTQEYERIIVFKDVLHGTYKIIDDEGHVTDCDMISTDLSSISECLSHPCDLDSSTWKVLSLVVISGFLDGINPCAFAVLLYFVTLLFATGFGTQEWEKRRILELGSLYIVAIYITYLAIGLAIQHAITNLPFTPQISMIGALVVIAAGIIKLKDRFWPDRGVSLKLSPDQWETVRRWMRKATFPATFTVGIMVTVFEFPCTGGIYIAILGILGTQTTFIRGLTYLLLYNLAFILPLIAILLLAFIKELGNFSIIKWKNQEKKQMNLIEGSIYITLGIFLLLLGFV